MTLVIGYISVSTSIIKQIRSNTNIQGEIGNYTNHASRQHNISGFIGFSRRTGKPNTTTINLGSFYNRRVSKQIKDSYIKTKKT